MANRKIYFSCSSVLEMGIFCSNCQQAKLLNGSELEKERAAFLIKL